MFSSSLRSFSFLSLLLYWLYKLCSFFISALLSSWKNVSSQMDVSASRLSKIFCRSDSIVWGALFFLLSDTRGFGVCSFFSFFCFIFLRVYTTFFADSISGEVGANSSWKYSLFFFIKTLKICISCLHFSFSSGIGFFISDRLCIF